MEHLVDHLGLVVCALQRHVARHGHRMVQAGGQLSDLFVSLGEARRLLGGPGGDDVPGAVSGQHGWPTAAEAARALEGGRRRVAARLARTAAAPEPPRLPLEELRATFALTDRQVRLLVAAAAPGLSVDLARLYTFAWADFAQKLPPVSFLAELLADDPRELPELVAELEAGAALVGAALVETRDGPAYGPGTPAFHRLVVVPDAVVAFLQGRRPPLAPDLAAACRHVPAEEALPRADVVLPDATLAAVQAALGAPADRRGRPLRLLLTGAPGAGRRTALGAFLAELGQGVLVVDLAVLAREREGFGPRLARVLRDAGLRGATALLRGDDALADEAQLRAAGPELAAVLARHPTPVVLTARASQPLLHRLVPGMVVVDVPSPDLARQEVMWARHLAEAEAAVEEGLPARLAVRFRLTPGAIARAAGEAAAQVALAGAGRERATLTLADVQAAVARGISHELAALAQPVATRLGWDDVVLPAEVKETLREIVAHATLQATVFQAWGFARKFEYGRGLACLFSGPPGTGKTMMAAILARELGRDLFRVDLSRISSKWVGETEKNLSRVFDEADKAQVILLFDEADSLFSKRTQVQSSNDRFANAEVNYLLQRMEAYEGVTILTTNFDKEIDEAFKRRLRFKVRFPMPDEEHRLRLWQGMMPDDARVADDVDYETLARRFELSGGSIKNALLRAAFLAAAGEGVITEAHLEHAASAEAREMGVLVRG